MSDALMAGILLRVIQIAAYTAPTILCGLLVAGVFRRLLGVEGVRKLFGADDWHGLIRAWGLGMLLPVCSIGAIPILREMRRAGLSGGTIMAFALSAPLFNPLSILYGLTLSNPAVILCFAFCSLVLVTVIGLAWGRLFPNTRAAPLESAPIAPGIRRMAAVLLVACREIAGPTLGYALVALVGVAGLAFMLPAGELQRSLHHTDWSAPLLMFEVGIPACTTPTIVMSQIGLMFDHGNSVGAALILLTVGAGINVGTIAWILRQYGVKSTLGWFGLFAGVVLALAYAVEYPLYFAGDVPADHTHAFDMYCAPFATDIGYPWPTVHRLLGESVGRHEWQSLAALGVLLAIGLATRVADRWWSVEEFVERVPVRATPTRRLDVYLPNSVLGSAAIFGLIVFSIVGAYLYYPAPEEVLEDIRIVRAETLTAALQLNDEQTDRFVEMWDDRTRRLEIGVLIRRFEVPPELSELALTTRHRLDDLRHAVEDREKDKVNSIVRELNDLSRKTRALFPEPTGSPR